MQRSSALILFLGGVLMLAGFALMFIGAGQKLLEGELTDIPLIVGLSLFAIIPGSILYGLARQVLRHGPSVKRGLIGLVFTAPLFAFACGLSLLTEQNIVFIAAIFVICALLALWALMLIRAAKKQPKPSAP